MAKTVKLYINGVEKHFERLHYVKSHPNPDPDTFNIVLDEAAAGDVVSFQTVEIKKDGVTEFYGFVEEITPDEDAESGTDVVVTGRCWKLIVWKKWNERFQESREIGPLESSGNVETGFFGSVNPVELFKFFLRCPVSLHPLGKIRHKIGWGIPSDSWECCANETAEARYPDWVSLRYTGLAWRVRGSVDTFSISTLVVDGFDNTSEEWDVSGTEPWLDTDDMSINMIFRNDLRGMTQANFTFEDMAATSEAVYSVILNVKHNSTTYGDECLVSLYDGTDWHDLGYLDHHGLWNWATQEFTVGTILDTVAKINVAQVRFYVPTGKSYRGMITYAYLKVTCGLEAEPVYQQDDDYFIIDLGMPFDRVTAAMFESRNNALCYPEHYKIQYTLLSSCCDETFPEDEWQDFEDCESAVNVANNTHRDVLHSWTPVDRVHGIRIKLTNDGSRPWEISQVYIWQADEIAFRLVEEAT